MDDFALKIDIYEMTDGYSTFLVKEGKDEMLLATGPTKLDVLLVTIMKLRQLVDSAYEDFHEELE